MNKIKKLIYIIIGIIAFVFGTIGIILPVLPTTPLYLLASFCFVRGSKKFDRWFKETKLYKSHLETFIKERAMTMKQKICLLAFADTMIMFPIIILDSIPIKLFLCALIAYKYYYFVFKIKTIKPEEKSSLVKGEVQ